MNKHYLKVNINLDTTGVSVLLDEEIENPKTFFGQYLQIKGLFNNATSELPKSRREIWLMNCDA